MENHNRRISEVPVIASRDDLDMRLKISIDGLGFQEVLSFDLTVW